MEWIKNLMIDMDINRVDLVKEGADDNAFIKYYKSKEGGSPMTFKEIIAKLKPEDKAIIEQEMANVAKKAEEDVKKEFPPADPEKKKTGEEDEEDNVEKSKDLDMEEVMKGLDPRVKAMFENMTAKAAAAEAVAKALVEKELDAEAVTKAKEVAGIGADEAKLVEIYKSLKDHDEKLCTEVFSIFKTAANIKSTEDDMFDEVAKQKGTEGTGASAWDKITNEAAEIAKSKNMTEAAAISEVIKMKPELYKEYLKEIKN